MYTLPLKDQFKLSRDMPEKPEDIAASCTNGELPPLVKEHLAEVHQLILKAKKGPITKHPKHNGVKRNASGAQTVGSPKRGRGGVAASGRSGAVLRGGMMPLRGRGAGFGPGRMGSLRPEWGMGMGPLGMGRDMGGGMGYDMGPRFDPAFGAVMGPGMGYEGVGMGNGMQPEPWMQRVGQRGGSRGGSRGGGQQQLGGAGGGQKGTRGRGGNNSGNNWGGAGTGGRGGRGRGRGK